MGGLEAIRRAIAKVILKVTNATKSRRQLNSYSKPRSSKARRRKAKASSKRRNKNAGPVFVRKKGSNKVWVENRNKSGKRTRNHSANHHGRKPKSRNRERAYAADPTTRQVSARPVGTSGYTGYGSSVYSTD
ncbi:hypothetical protein JX265_002485 [Neoarthrinium moseri]|uniref:Uncharacterized protein n=1 Tax=Neoarthrinium moseri TaxID=1658444 RepID=A0A9P9WV53_9PEZI|nr:uncharacterized protein JN550_000299 [Neoarthrinium moseri]KAI1854846.1 hypothetical protein JX266_000964 [Neoarthrinium moseri]KAI1878117.1 hypothetical protein JN550_000299 [Neoarthrinium moseri]KAI1879531.1 hypothetical protein JX265_002485 [Neoarthrinium moseri]